MIMIKILWIIVEPLSKSRERNAAATGFEAEKVDLFLLPFFEMMRERQKDSNMEKGADCP
jgi:hypothetical protein